VNLPIIGSVHVDGLTVEQAQQALREAFRPYLKDPWVIVEVTEFRSKPIHLIGQFKMPGTYYMDRPFNLIQAISVGNGLDPTANLRGARVLRSGKILPVDILRLLKQGDMSQNVWLKAGDAIYVPDRGDQNVFVIGAVKKPGPIPMINGQLTLPQALSSAGFDETLSYDSGIHIIRSLSPTRGELIVIDLEKMLRGDALAFSLFEGDIIYVSKSAIGNWNVALSEILPSLQAVSAVLNPFVQIKYLSK
jgi:polysaccharide export outer membrane protein